MVPRSCDTMVALGEATENGQTIFAKNSDRPSDECQPLVRVQRRDAMSIRPTARGEDDLPARRFTPLLVLGL
jgi:dipeptidase